MPHQHTTMRPCEHCGTPFKPLPPSASRGRFCSRACAGAHRRVQVACICETCGATFTRRRSRVAEGNVRFCSKRCLRNPSPHTRPLAERFWEKVDRSGGPDACWPWLATKNRGGYGTIWDPTKGRGVTAHRVAFTLAKGLPPVGAHILHTCPGGDNPSCCNPSHLRAGTRQDNMRDMSDRGRNGRHTRPETTARGERHGEAKLTAEAVREIRRQYSTGTTTYYELGLIFNVDKTTIGAVVRRDIWQHVE